MDIRAEIRGILKEVFSEAAPTPHFKDRVYDRLTSSLYTKPSFDYSKVEGEINILKSTNFDPSDSFAVFLKSFPVTYVSKDPFTGTPSIGDELWAVVRDNEITTIFFRNSHQRDVKVSGVNNVLHIKKLVKNYSDSEKNADGTVDFEIAPTSKRPTSSRKRVSIDLPVVDLAGSKWYIDEPNEEIIYTKNIKKKLSFDDLSEDYLEKIINAVTV